MKTMLGTTAIILALSSAAMAQQPADSKPNDPLAQNVSVVSASTPSIKAEPVTVPTTPFGGGDPDTIVCRAPQPMDGGQLGPKVCASNHDWHQMAMSGKAFGPDGKTLVDLPLVDRPKGDGDPDAVTCRTPVDLQILDRIKHVGPKVCQTNKWWADIIKNHQMVDARGVVTAQSVGNMGNGGDPFHNPGQQGMGRMMGGSGAPF